MNLIKKLGGCTFETVVDIQGRIVETWNYTYRLKGLPQTLAEALTLLKQLNLVELNREIANGVLLLHEEELNQVECLFREFKVYTLSVLDMHGSPKVLFTGATESDEFTFFNAVLLPIICNKKLIRYARPREGPDQLEAPRTKKEVIYDRMDLLSMGSKFKLYGIIKDDLFSIPITKVNAALKQVTIDYHPDTNSSLIRGPRQVLQDLHAGFTALFIPHLYTDYSEDIYRSLEISKTAQDKLYQHFSIYVNNRGQQSPIALYMKVVNRFF